MRILFTKSSPLCCVAWRLSWRVQILISSTLMAAVKGVGSLCLVLISALFIHHLTPTPTQWQNRWSPSGGEWDESVIERPHRILPGNNIRSIIDWCKKCFISLLHQSPLLVRWWWWLFPSKQLPSVCFVLFIVTPRATWDWSLTMKLGQSWNDG